MIKMEDTVDNRKMLRTGDAEKEMNEGTFIELGKEENGIVDETDLISDREFLDKMIKEIEENRARKLTYDKEFKNDALQDWRAKREKEDLFRRIREKAKIKKEKEKKHPAKFKVTIKIP